MSGFRRRTDSAHHGRRQHEQRFEAAHDKAVGIDVHHAVVVNPRPQVDAAEVLLRKYVAPFASTLQEINNSA